MDQKVTPYLYESGLVLDFKQLLTAEEIHGQVRLAEDKIFNNGMMTELRRNLKPMLDKLFFDVLKSILPLRIIEDERFPEDYKRFFGGRFKTYEVTYNKKRKTKSQLTAFMLEEFSFFAAAATTKQVDTPRKKALKKKIGELQKSNERLIATCDALGESSNQFAVEIRKLEAEIVEKEVEIREVTTKLSNLNKEKKSLQQKVHGLKSGMARKTRLFSEGAGPPVMSITASVDKGTGSLIEGILDNDLIIVEANMKDNKIFEGKRYLGNCNADKKSTSGHLNTYLESSNVVKSCSLVSKKEVQKRCKLLDRMADSVAAGAVDDKQILYAELIRLNQDIFRNSLKDAGFCLMDKLTPSQAISIQSLLRLPTNRIRNLRISLSNLNKNIFPSERQIRREKAPMVSHVSSDVVESGVIALRKTKNDDITLCSFVRVNNLVSFIEEIIKRDVGFNDDVNFDGKWWILFSGDKGGHHMKFHVEVLNSVKAGSVDNVHIYCMFEATDSVENMLKVWSPYRKQIQMMMEEGYKIMDRELMIFLGGDYHFLDDMLGHQGSSASYPSNLDKVELFHLQNHGGLPHTPEDCNFQLRTVNDYVENYNENLADDRNRGNMNANGKFHCSVSGPMIFPLKDLSQVVPATLHILLGVVLLIYNMLLQECKNIDSEEGGEKMSEHASSINEEWELSSLELDAAERSLREHGVSVVVMINRSHRYAAMLDGDHQLNVDLAKGSVAQKTSRKRKASLDNCSSPNCFITHHDDNVEWVQCNLCGKWYHAMCDAILPSEEHSSQNYQCLYCCRGDDVNIGYVFDSKIATLLQEEDDLNNAAIACRIKCDDLKCQYTKIVGDREKQLTDALENMKVVRQAYHGNVMVGNHCVIILKRFRELTAVIADKVDIYARYNIILILFSSIMKYVMARRFLTDSEICKVSDLCEKFGREFPCKFPHRNITRKIHELIFSVPRFIKRFKTIGLLSEQEGESKHASVNAELRSVACVRNHAEKIRLVLEKEELRSTVDKTLIKQKARMCNVCPGRVFLRAGVDGQKHCLNCEPELFTL